MLRCCWAVDWLPENSSKFSLKRCCGVGVDGLEVATVGNSFSRDSLMGVATERGLSFSALRDSSSSGRSSISPRSSSVKVDIESQGEGEQTGNIAQTYKHFSIEVVYVYIEVMGLLPKTVFRRVNVHDMVIYIRIEHAHEFRELCNMALWNIKMCV